MVTPEPKANTLAAAPPVRFWIDVKLSTPVELVRLPAFLAVMLNVLVRFGPTRMLEPPPPLAVPVNEPLVPTVNVSTAEPPVRLPKLAKLSPLTVPLLAAVMAQALATLRAGQCVRRGRRELANHRLDPGERGADSGRFARCQVDAHRGGRAPEKSSVSPAAETAPAPLMLPATEPEPMNSN